MSMTRHISAEVTPRAVARPQRRRATTNRRPDPAAPAPRGAGAAVGIVAMARIRQVHRQIGADARRPVAEHDHPVGEQQRLLDVVRHHQDGEAAALPQPRQLALHGEAGQAVELAQRLVEDQQAADRSPGRGRARRAAPCRRRAGAGRPWRISRGRPAPAPRRRGGAAASAGRGPPARARRCATPCATDRASGPGRPRRARDRDR